MNGTKNLFSICDPKDKFMQKVVLLLWRISVKLFQMESIGSKRIDYSSLFVSLSYKFPNDYI